MSKIVDLFPKRLFTRFVYGLVICIRVCFLLDLFHVKCCS